MGIYVSKSAFGPGSIMTAGPKSERREEDRKGGASSRQEAFLWVWLLAAVLQAR